MSETVAPPRRTPPGVPSPRVRGHSAGGVEEQSWFKRNKKVLVGSVVGLLATATSLFALHNQDNSDKQAALATARKDETAQVSQAKEQATTQATAAATTAAITREFGLLGFNVTRPGNDEIEIVAVAKGYAAKATNPKLATQLTENVGEPLSANPAEPPFLEVVQAHPTINSITGAVMGSSPTQTVVIHTPAQYETLVAGAVSATSTSSTPSS